MDWDIGPDTVKQSDIRTIFKEMPKVVLENIQDAFDFNKMTPDKSKGKQAKEESKEWTQMQDQSTIQLYESGTHVALDFENQNNNLPPLSEAQNKPITPQKLQIEQDSEVNMTMADKSVEKIPLIKNGLISRKQLETQSKLRERH